MEIVWDTRQFNNMWPTDGSQPFIFSQGDPTGFGQHADYVFGWDGDALQRAMDQCTDISGVPEQCRALTVLSDSQINSCKQQVRVDEVVEGRCESRTLLWRPLSNCSIQTSLPSLVATLLRTVLLLPP